VLALIVAGCQTTPPVTADNPHQGTVNHPELADDTAAFRARLKACSQSATTYNIHDANAAIELRIFFKRNGRLAAPPQLLRSKADVDAIMLTKMAITALQRCQPFPELPADKYKEWKTLDLVVTPLAVRN
jgi:hypothetical protein